MQGLSARPGLQSQTMPAASALAGGVEVGRGEAGALDSAAVAVDAAVGDAVGVAVGVGVGVAVAVGVEEPHAAAVSATASAKKRIDRRMML